MPRRTTAALVAVLLLSAGLARAQETVEVDAEIVLAVDASRSMDLAEFAVQRDGYLQALRHPDLIRAITAGPLGRIAIAYFEWSGQAQDGSLVPWRVIDGPAAAAGLADEIATMPVARTRGTSISRAIQFATVLIEDDAIEGTRRVIDVSGDGANNVGPPVAGARDEALARGITINGLPIVISEFGAQAGLDLYYEDCVIGGEGAFMVVAQTGEDLARTIRRKLILEISGLAPPARLVPAQFEPTDCLIGEKLYRQRDWDQIR
ncbi:MAG TPA: DUF1194 domain-containing protein [Amaricoccus sp.]|nr:DUF1194 domain-containing protein [Amaricoccus sp.]